jgi:hypothetical protein
MSLQQSSLLSSLFATCTFLISAYYFSKIQREHDINDENYFVLKRVKSFDVSIGKVFRQRSRYYSGSSHSLTPDKGDTPKESFGPEKLLHHYSMKPKALFTVEVCLSDIESANNARRGGCNSIEVCSDRPQGGITPSYGLVEEIVRNKGDVDVHVLIRPRYILCIDYILLIY